MGILQVVHLRVVRCTDFNGLIKVVIPREIQLNLTYRLLQHRLYHLWLWFGIHKNFYLFKRFSLPCEFISGVIS
jgi:hypothetical protein